MEEEEREGNQERRSWEVDVSRRRPKSWNGVELGEGRSGRRRTTPLLKDCREALSTLLWEPYEVRGGGGQSEPSRRHATMAGLGADPCVVPVHSVSVVRVNQERREPPPEDAPDYGRRRRRHRLPDLLDLPPPYTPPPPLTLPFHHLIPSRRRGTGSVYREVPKSCCGVLSPAAAVSLRWFMILLLTVGVCCALVGTVLGATRATAPHHLTIALLMIGVGIVLVTVSGVAWRLMSHESPSCRAMLGLASQADADPNRRFLPRLPPSYGRPHHPYAAMMYPEFQYRAPPPSYQASMQEYRLRLLLLDRQPASPPPTYRSHPTTLLRGGLGRLGMDHSRPPSYRSRTSSTRHEISAHSRQASSIKDGGLPSKEEHCTVTIVGSETEPPPGPVIVTISGRDLPPPPPPPADHIQILAHL